MTGYEELRYALLHAKQIWYMYMTISPAHLLRPGDGNGDRAWLSIGGCETTSTALEAFQKEEKTVQYYSVVYVCIHENMLDGCLNFVTVDQILKSWHLHAWTMVSYIDIKEGPSLIWPFQQKINHAVPFQPPARYMTTSLQDNTILSFSLLFRFFFRDARSCT